MPERRGNRDALAIGEAFTVLSIAGAFALRRCSRHASSGRSDDISYADFAAVTMSGSNVRFARPMLTIGLCRPGAICRRIV